MREDCLEIPDENGSTPDFVRLPKRYATPCRLLAAGALSVLLAEIFVTLVVGFLPTLPPAAAVLLEWSLFLILALPALYFFFMRPLGRLLRQLRQHDELLREQKDFELRLVKYSAVPTFVIDRNHRVIYWNKACERLTGVRAEEIIGTDTHYKVFYGERRPCLADIILDGEEPTNLAQYYRTYYKSILVPKGWHAEAWFDNIGGRKRYITFEAAPIYNNRGETVAAIETLQDITDRKMLEERLEVSANYDALTCLFNRRKIDDLLESEIDRALRYRTELGIILFDIDHFKQVNDTFGHAAGDVALREVARLVSDSIRMTDLFGRWGGEEFLILLPSTGPEQTRLLAEKLRRRVAEYEIEAVGAVTVSAGATSLQADDTLESLLSRVDQALYAAKRGGRNRVESL